MEVIGYIGALLIGITLGLIGGGGSILAVPIFTYLFKINEKLATAYSLFVVGTSALVGGLKQNANGFVDWRTSFVFGIPAVISVTLIRRLVIPQLPAELFTIGDFVFTSRMAMLGLFAVLMIPAAITMLKGRKERAVEENAKVNYFALILQGLIIGAVSGFVGAGGGFLIIPALVIFARLEMKRAVGTSLIIIAFNSVLGFLMSDAFSPEVNWAFLALFSGISLVGIFIGTYLGKFIDGKKLKKSFGFFIIAMAIFIFYMEFFVKA